MQQFSRFIFPTILVLLLSGPVVPHLWNRERASAVTLAILLLLCVGLTAVTFIEYTR